MGFGHTKLSAFKTFWNERFPTLDFDPNDPKHEDIKQTFEIGYMEGWEDRNSYDPKWDSD